MPVFNEADGISEFLTEIDAEFRGENYRIVVIDDCSTDSTREILVQLASDILVGKLVVKMAPVNRGHGPTTVTALQEALKYEADFVVAVDGDGQFKGADIRRLVVASRGSDCDVTEGVRNNRTQPWFRRITTLTVRILVTIKSRSRPPIDANTPLRVYRKNVLSKLIQVLPKECLIPNLVISAMTRRSQLDVCEIPVESLPRRGSGAVEGTMFGTQRTLPNRKFICFLIRATIQFISIKLVLNSKNKSIEIRP